MTSATLEAAKDGTITGTVLAFDFGTRRTGVAQGETSLRLAHPLTTIVADRDDLRLEAIAPLIDTWRPSQLVVGLPTHADATPHALTKRARKFGRQLGQRFKLPVTLIDERFTTQAATDALRDAGVDARAQKAVRDQVAAALILQAFFDGHGIGRVVAS